MNNEIAIEIRDVVKDFRIYHRTYANLKGQATALVHSLAKRRKVSQYFLRRALDHVNLSIRRGEAVAIVGHNGSGKSTLLSILSRIYLPSAGSLEYRGSLMSLLELGSGFHFELTGQENVLFNAALRGMRQDQIRNLYARIVEFAEMTDETMALPVRMYSSGMLLRLAFAVIVNMEADILVVDEALAVGDEAFQEKCFAAMEAFKAQGKTIIIVSHELDHVERFASRVVWLDKGSVRLDGGVDEVLSAYRDDMHKPQHELT